MVRRRQGPLFSCLSLAAPTLLDAYEYSISIEGTAPVDRETSGCKGHIVFCRDMADLDCVDDHSESNHGVPMYRSTGAERFGLSA